MPPIAHTAIGDLAGLQGDGVAVFRAVPYAAPPLAEHRFAPPTPARAWSGLRDATRHGPIAPQAPSRLRVAMGDFDREQNEDCLTLTIWTPSADARARPVLVWLHGGAWISGAGSLDWYDGSTLAREGDIVVVGVNYRLGALGYLHHPAISPGNLGTLDQQAALAWVARHIAGFGGDPARVTLAGQSAGAASAGHLIAEPASRALFRRAILQSGGFGRPPASLEHAAGQGARFLRLLDIDPDSAAAPAAMRDIPTARLIAAQGALAQANARFAETTPPFMLVAAPGTPAAIAAARPEILIGATREEVHAFFAANPAMADPDPEAVAARFAALTGRPDGFAAYRARRPGGGTMDLLADLVTDHTFLWPAMRLAEAVADAGGRVFAYQFDWAPPHSRFKACHCIDLPFVFGSFAAFADAPMLAGDDGTALSTSIRRSWIGFVRDGQPGSPELPWPTYDRARRATMRLDDICAVSGDPAGLAWRG